MTWAGVYRALGGQHPDDPPNERTERWERWHRECQLHRLFPDRFPEPWPDVSWDLADVLFELLLRLGFLRRDETLSSYEAGCCVNFRWQWRFWRGPYREAFLKQFPGSKPPSWWSTAFRRLA